MNSYYCLSLHLMYYLIWLHASDLLFQDSSDIAEQWRVHVIILYIFFHSFIFQIFQIFLFLPCTYSIQLRSQRSSFIAILYENLCIQDSNNNNNKKFSSPFVQLSVLSFALIVCNRSLSIIVFLPNLVTFHQNPVTCCLYTSLCIQATSFINRKTNSLLQ